MYDSREGEARHFLPLPGGMSAPELSTSSVARNGHSVHYICHARPLRAVDVAFGLEEGAGCEEASILRDGGVVIRKSRGYIKLNQGGLEGL